MMTSFEVRRRAERIARAFVDEAAGRVRHIGRKGAGQPAYFEVLDASGAWVPDKRRTVADRVRVLCKLTTDAGGAPGYRQRDQVLHAVAQMLEWVEPESINRPARHK